MWVVIHIAKNADSAIRIRSLLKAEGFMVKIRRVFKDVPREENCFEVRVLASEAEEARDVLADRLT
ncbi:MAG: glutamate decarboxylase [Clostridiales bacterium]|nr:glutamate decarboxylase [Clostridiales bacterium]